MTVTLIKNVSPPQAEPVLPDREETRIDEKVYYFSESQNKWMMLDEMMVEHLLRVIKKVVRGAVRNYKPHGKVRDARFMVVRKEITTRTEKDEYTVPSFINT